MSRLRRWATIVALLAVTLFFRSFLVFSGDPGQDGNTSTTFLSKDCLGTPGCPEEPQDSRIAIPTEGPSATMALTLQDRGTVSAEASQVEAKLTAQPASRVHRAFRRIAAKRRASSARSQRQFIGNGFF